MSRRPRRQNRFTGPLAKKIIATDAAEIARQQEEKMKLLAERYSLHKVDPIPWGLVALAMAKELVPGFKLGKPHAHRSGRPGTWKTGRGAALVADAHAVMDKEGLPLAAALLKVGATAKPKRPTLKTLLNRYYEEIRRQADAVRRDQEAFASFASLLGDRPGWTVSARIRRAAVTERSDPQLERFLAELRRLLIP